MLLPVHWTVIDHADVDVEGPGILQFEEIRTQPSIPLRRWRRVGERTRSAQRIGRCGMGIDGNLGTSSEKRKLESESTYAKFRTGAVIVI